MAEHKASLTLVVSGQATVVETNVNAPLAEVIHKALQQTDNEGQPPANWELRDEAGNVLDPHTKVADLHLTPTSKLFLSLRAGIGG
jgi:Protein of Unknown function (DUF2604)